MTDVDITGSLFQLPETIDDALYSHIAPITTAQLTQAVGGDGVFDILMTNLKAHMKVEFDAGRITGAEYSKTYIALTSAALETASQFVLGKDAAYWAAQQSQIQAITGKLAMEKIRTEIFAARYDFETNAPIQTSLLNLQVTGAGLQNTGLTTQNSISSYNLTNILPEQLALATAEVTGKTTENSISAYNLASMLPEQLALLTAQVTGAGTQNSITAYNLANMLPAQLALLTTQEAGEILKNDGQSTENDIASYQLATVLPGQVAYTVSQKAMVDDQAAGVLVANSLASYNLANIAPAQLNLVKEQGEVQHAQTSNTRLDGTTAIVGLIGQQKSLYAQQITSYQRDAEVKAAKLFTDAWITTKTIDDGTTPPNNFENPQLNTILTSIMTNNSIGVPLP